jgi:Flp pilus assembly protein TadD
MTRRGKRRSGTRRQEASPSPRANEKQQSSSTEKSSDTSVGGISAWWTATAVVLVVCAVAVLGNYLNGVPAVPAPKIVADITSLPTSVVDAVARYVGRDRCGACHSSEVNAWTSSHHAHSMQPATATSVHGDFDNAQFVDGGVTTTFFRRDDKFMIRTDGSDSAIQEFEAKFTFGISPLEQYLLELPGGRLQAFTIAWDTRPKASGGQRWFRLGPNETIKGGDPLHWTGLQQNWNFECAECHSTDLRRNYDPVAGVYRTTYSEINVSCESCHGPGSRHEAWAHKEPGWEGLTLTKGLANSLDERRDISWVHNEKTGDSARSSPRHTTREIDTCARCHSRRGPIWGETSPGGPIGDGYRVALLDPSLYFPDGQIRDEVYEYGSFLQSRMFHAGVTCSDCHEPHSLALRAPGNGVCLQCHASEKYENTTHHRHALSSTGAQCASCHMPSRDYMVVDPRRDHSIRIPRPDLSVSLGTPNACNECHTDKSPQWAVDQVKSWYGSLNLGFQHFAETIQASTVGSPGVRDQLLALANDASNPDIVRASAVSRLDHVVNAAEHESLRALLHDADPLVRRSAVEAYLSGPPSLRIDVLSLIGDPIRDVRLAAVRILATVPSDSLNNDARSRRSKGVEEYVAAQNSNADRPEAHHNLGVLFGDLGRVPEAEAEFKRALELDPNFVPAAVTLADLYRGTGRDAGGEGVLRAMLARVPSAATVHHALGLWMVRSGRHQEALAELKLAAQLAPDNTHLSYVYAVALGGAGDRGQALDVLHEILSRHGYDRESLFAAAGFERDAGHVNEALSYAKRLAELEPEDRGVQRLLSELRH